MSGCLSERPCAVYDILSDTWGELEGVEQRAGHCMVTVDNGKLLVCGGEIIINGRRFLTRELFSIELKI